MTVHTSSAISTQCALAPVFERHSPPHPVSYYSNAVYISSSSPSLLLRSIGSSRISTPGPTGLELRCAGNTCHTSNQQKSQTLPSTLAPPLLLCFSSCRPSPVLGCVRRELTFVPPHPNLQAASCATNSPNPNINPFTNGKIRLIAAPRAILQNVGGE